jgi:hypothetical protein
MMLNDKDYYIEVSESYLYYCSSSLSLCRCCFINVELDHFLYCNLYCEDIVVLHITVA